MKTLKNKQKMKKLEFIIEIATTKEKVWDALWLEENYKNWTSVFMEGSYAESDWKEGSEIRFLSPGKNGMFGIIEKMIPFEKMYFKHLGEIQNGVKQAETYGEEATERYDLKEENGKITLSATMNAPEEYLIYFTNIFPKALEKIKEISEK
jgi:hypothetical protein